MEEDENKVRRLLTLRDRFIDDCADDTSWLVSSAAHSL